MISRKGTTSQFPNLNDINERDFYSGTCVSVRLQGFSVFILTCSLCNDFKDSYRFLMLDQCLLKPPGVFLLVMRKDQTHSD